MIPQTVSARCNSPAEKRVFRLLEATDWGRGAAALHSLNISRHEYKRMGELDFVVFSPRAILVLEVKGGGVSCHEGLWTFVDRYGVEHHSSEGPFNQGRSGMFALEGLLREHAGRGPIANLVFGHAAVFPDCDFDVASVEWDDAIVIDQKRLKGRKELHSTLTELLTYWQAKAIGAAGLDEDAATEILDLLRPDFDRVPSLVYRADELDAATERLTDEQYQNLDLIDENERIVCAGGAGTGKTFLAAELARREASRGKRVLVVTRSSTLAAFIQSRLLGYELTVASIDELPAGPFDVLIVDEGQDLLEISILDQLDSVLTKGLDGGRWRWFYDANNQSGFYANAEDEAMELLRSAAHTFARLTLNCRNTNEIVTQTRFVTGADLGLPTVGTGPSVEYQIVKSLTDEASWIAKHLDQLAEEGVMPGQVTILSLDAEDFASSSAAALPHRWRQAITTLTAELVGKTPWKEITWSSVKDFKGLENRYVLLVDLHRLSDAPTDLSKIYVGMSRPRVGLWIALPKALESEWANLSLRNLEGVLPNVSN
jgi:hypothetical protein